MSDYLKQFPNRTVSVVITEEAMRDDGASFAKDIESAIAEAPHASSHFEALSAGRQQSESRGIQYWRSLDELADTQEFRGYMERELIPAQKPSCRMLSEKLELP